MLQFGPADSPSSGPVVVVAQPLFEEANRTRALIVTLLRKLALRGVTSALPDLPGTAESMTGTADASLDDWRAAFSAACDHAAYWGPIYTLAIRSGVLIDGAGHAFGHWRLAPVDGAEWIAELFRGALLGEAGFRDLRLHEVPDGPPVTIFGTPVSRRALIALQAAKPAQPGKVRTVRLETNRAEADRHVPGTPLWRRAEPDNDPTLAALLADDIADWIATCEG